MSEELMELAKIRGNFSKVTGELIEHYYEFDRETAANFQAGLVALKIKYGRNFDAYSVRGADSLAEKLQKSQITAEELEAARAYVDLEDKGGVYYEVPPFGTIADILGLVKAADFKASKNLLMQVQAVTRSFNNIDSVKYNAHEETLRLREVVYNLNAEPNSGHDGVKPKFSRDFIGRNDPPELVAAQALDHLSEIVKNLMLLPETYDNKLLDLMEVCSSIYLQKAYEHSLTFDTSSPALNQDLKRLCTAMQSKLFRVNKVDITKPEIAGVKMEELKQSLESLFKDLDRRGLVDIQGARLNDIRILTVHRFNQVMGKNVGHEIGA